MESDIFVYFLETDVRRIVRHISLNGDKKKGTKMLMKEKKSFSSF